jgi:hypothetical protein
LTPIPVNVVHDQLLGIVLAGMLHACLMDDRYLRSFTGNRRMMPAVSVDWQHHPAFIAKTNRD